MTQLAVMAQISTQISLTELCHLIRALAFDIPPLADDIEADFDVTQTAVRIADKAEPIAELAARLQNLAVD